MRWIALLVVGIFMGVLGTTTSLSIVAQQKHYPRALMTVMDYQLRSLAPRKAVACDPEQLQARKARLTLLAGDIALATDDSAQMRSLAGDFAAALTPLSCASLDRDLARIAESCDACHQQMR